MNHPLFEKLQALSEGKLTEAEEEPVAPPAAVRPPSTRRAPEPPPSIVKRPASRPPAPSGSERLDGLNPAQRLATTTTEGPVLILAGAGSGKTRVITFRIAHLIEEAGVRPEQILAVTFTNKAAGEMRERVERLLGDEPRSGSPLIATFHALCVRILRRDIEKLERGFTRSFTIYDADEQQRLIRQCIRDCGLDDKQLTPRVVQSAISGAKNRGESPESYAARADHGVTRKQEIARIYPLYEQRLHNSNALDFDDLLLMTVQLLRHSTETRHYYHQRFRHVLVDEFQDTNGIQYSLTRMLVEGDLALNLGRRPDDFWQNRSLCVVGDESQAIYGWRGSDFQIILGFEKDFPNVKVIKLEDNYRSTARILQAANHVIAHNTERFDKVLRANNNEGEKLRYAQLYDGEEESRWIISRIEEHRRKEPSLRAAVLYRTNAQSRLFEEACRRAGIRYNLVGGFSFYERSEVKDIISYLKLALNPADGMALLRVINTPARGIGKSSLDEIDRLATRWEIPMWEAVRRIVAEETLPARVVNALKPFHDLVNSLSTQAADPSNPLGELIKSAIIESGYERMLKSEGSEEAEARLLNLEELVNAAVESEQRGETLRDFLDHAALVSDTDQYEGEAPVTLMTMHAAKGLEFPLVFIAGLEENLFPHSRSSGDNAALEEERRLCYVAITRAEKYLYLTHARLRRVYGETLPTEPSRFLNEFPIELIDDLSRTTSWLGSARKPSNSPPTAKSTAPARENRFTGQTYNSVDGVRDFLARQGRQHQPAGDDAVKPRPSARSGPPESAGDGEAGATGLAVGTRVRHPKYGVGLIIRREGDGEKAKLTINFPGFGQKKLIEKFAGLQPA
jgi:DNA helicase-2/ATP-dependent DNA helicase PcrA